MKKFVFLLSFVIARFTRRAARLAAGPGDDD
jgi:hypothetical protein